MENMDKKSRVQGDSKENGAQSVKPDPRIEGERIDEVIELSEIAVVKPPGEDSIIELTEDAGASGAEGVSGLGGGEGDGASPGKLSAQVPVMPGKEDDIFPIEDAGLAGVDKIDAIEEDITKELDNYFQLEEQAIDLLDETIDRSELRRPAAPEAVNVFDEEPVSFAGEQFETALENVIEKLYAEKIDRILNEVIERVVTDDIEKLREYILKNS